MRRKARIRLIFREINILETKNLKTFMCQCQESPDCLVLYKETRINQPACCVKCLYYLGISDDYPRISG